MSVNSDNGENCMVQGRIVFVGGDLFSGAIANQYGTQNPRLNKKGEVYKEYVIGLAVPKSSFAPSADPRTGVGPGQLGEIWSAMHKAAMKLFPNGQIPPSFKMKYKDGDTGTNQDGTPVNIKTGYPGCLVFTLKTTIAPKFFRFDPNSNTNVQITEGIKCGDYVNVQVNIQLNPGTNAGLYLNPNAVQFVAHGEPIVNAPSGDQIFGVQAPPIPMGGSAQPVAQAGYLMPTPGAMPAQAPQTPPTPHFGILPQSHQPQAPQAPAQVPSFPQPAPQQFAQPQVQQFAAPVPQQQWAPQPAPMTPSQGMPIPGFPAFPGQQ